MFIISIAIDTEHGKIVTRYLRRRLPIPVEQAFSSVEVAAWHLVETTSAAEVFKDLPVALELMKTIDENIYYNSARSEYAFEYEELVKDIYQVTGRHIPEPGLRDTDNIFFELAMNHMQPVPIQLIASSL